MSQRRTAWLIPLVYLALSIVFFLPAILTQRVPLPLENAYTFPDPYWAAYAPASLSSAPNFTGYDIANYWHPYMLVVVERLLGGEIPLWNPHIFSGMPLLAAQQAAVLYPLNWMFLPLGPFWIWVGTGIARIFLMGWGLHLLMRRFGTTHIAAFWSGVTYQFAGSNIAYLHWVNHNVLAWLPLALYATDRLLHAPRGRWFLLLTACLAFQFLGGHPETSVLYALVWGSFALVRIPGRAAVGRSMLLLGGAVVAAIGLTLPQLIPALELIPQSPVFMKRTSESFLATLNSGIGQWSNLRQYLHLVNPYINGTPLGNRAFNPDLTYHLFVTYMGVLTLPWAVAGMVGGRPRAIALYWTVLAIVSLNLTYILPGFDWLLTLPVISLGSGIRFNLSFNLAAAVLAGFGIDWVLRGNVRARWLVLGVATLCMVLLGASMYDLVTATRGSWVLNGTPGPVVLRRIAAFFNRDSGQVVGLLAVAALGWLVLLGLIRTTRRRVVVVLLLAITYVELLIHGVPFNGFARPAYAFPPTPVTHALRQTPEHFRISTLDGVLKGNASMTQGLDNALGYDDLVSFRYQLFAGRSSKIGLDDDTYVIQPLAQRFFDLANVRYLLTTKPVEGPPGVDWPLMMQDGDVRVYQNPTALPRAYIVPTIRVVAPDQAIGTVYEPSFDPRREAIIEERIPELESTQESPVRGDVTITRYAPEHVILDVAADRTALVVLADSYDVGWRVAVDGKPAQLYRANAVYRGVVVPTGSHRIEFTYRPVSWEIGLKAAALTLVLCLGGCWWARQRRLRAMEATA